MHGLNEVRRERLVETGCFEQALLREPFAIEQARLILRAVVAQDRHDGVTGTEPPRDLHGRRHVDAAGAAEEQTFVAQQAIDGAHALDVGHMQRVVDRRAFEIRGDAADADAFGDRARAGRLQLAIAQPVIQRAALRIGERDAAHRVFCRFR